MPEPTNLVDVQRIQANGTVLHTETRGRGPTVLLIAGAGGDAAELAGVATTLADAFTVTTYDRRGNSRSPRPAGWAQTSLAEQADDAAALLAALGQRPAVVVGTSAGGSIALEVALRHPDAVRAAIVHEPPIMAGTTNPQAVTTGLGALIEQSMAAGGPPAAMELFLRWAAGDTAFASLDPADRDRYLDNGEVFFGVEMPPFMAYAPAVEAIADAPGPIVGAASHASRDPASPHHFLYQAAAWLARQVGTDLLEVPGAHMAYLTEPVAVAESLRPLLRERS
jgi:pimeloyl-ACP methyl ester carboxylesterase